jgi:predicted enzyme related to lactoylglutathione lyase
MFHATGNACLMTVTLEAGIVARDSKHLCDFYTTAMGFAMVDHRSFPVGEVYRLRRDDARLKIFHSVEPLDGHAPIGAWFQPGGWRYAALHVDHPAEVDALAASVGAANGRVLIAPTDHGENGRLALVCDPEGNAWELLA